MKKKKIVWSTLVLTIIITLIPMVYGTFFYSDLPEKLPGHFNFKNEVDRYDPKWVIIYVLPLVMALLQLTCMLIADLTKDPEVKEAKVIRLVKWVIPIISNVIVILSIMTALNYSVDVGKAITIFLSLVFIVLGNYTPKLPYEDAKRTGKIVPKSEDVYKKMMIRCGYAFVIGGVFSLITSFFDPVMTIGIILGDCLVIAIYSIYYTFKR